MSLLYGVTPDPADSYEGAGSLLHATEELYRIVPEVNAVHLALTLLSTFIVVFGLYSGLIKERLYVGEAIIATVIGIALSNYAAGVFEPRLWSEGHHFDEVTLELTRIVIALAVFAVGVELPRAYVWRHRKSLGMLLGPNMLIGWLLSAGFMYALVPALDFLSALVIAAGVTPTDPILASSVVGKGKFAQDHVPSHIRHILQAESGCNDGAAFPFLYLALFLLLREEHSIGQAIGWWILLVFIYQIVLGVLIGAFVGIVARKLLKFSKRRRLIDRESMVAMYVALALFVTGVTTLCGSDDLLAAFACGTAFAWDSFFLEAIEDSNFSSVIDLLANSAIFIYVGATMPFSAWNNEALTLTPWRLVILAILILLFRRIPAIFVMHKLIPDIKTKREALFVGHFGPMGVGAIFISTLAATKLPTPNIPPENKYDILALTIQPITYFIVLSSILVHGLTISFFSLGRRVHSRVASMTRTFTQASANSNNGIFSNNEPSWMTRVKRVVPGQEIVINRDDDYDERKKPSADESDAAERGELAHTGSSASSSGASAENEKKALSQEEKKEHEFEAVEKEGGKPLTEIEKKDGGAEEIATGKTDEEREADENPPDNLLEGLSEHERHRLRDKEEAHERLQEHEGEGETKPKRPTEPFRDESKREARYCRHGQTREWRDGRRIIIDHNDGGDVEVVEVDADDRAAKKAETVPGRSVVRVPESQIEQERTRSQNRREQFGSPERFEENAIGKAAQKLLRVAKLRKEDPSTLSHEEKERRKQERERLDAEIKREAHYCRGQDREEGQGSGTATPRQWIEGDEIVEERDDEHVTVRKLSEVERQREAREHLAALRALGHPVLALEEKFGRKRSRSPARATPTGDRAATPTSDKTDSDKTDSDKGKGRADDLSMRRTDRVEFAPEDDGPTTRGHAQRPEPSRRPSMLDRMKVAIGGGAGGKQSRPPPILQEPSTDRDEDDEGSRIARPRAAHVSDTTRSPSPMRNSIRFAELNRPSRSGPTAQDGSTPSSPPTARTPFFSGWTRSDQQSSTGLRRTATAPDSSSGSTSIRFAGDA